MYRRGVWQISVEQPTPDNVTPTQATTFASKGQDVTPYFTLPDGISQIAMQAPRDSSLIGYMYHLDDLGGEAVQAGRDGSDGQIFNFGSADNQTAYPISLPDDGPYVFYVTNDVKDTTPWTVSFS